MPYLDPSVYVLLGINILMGWSFYVILRSGQISLGNAGFMAIGAYSSSAATVKLGVPFGLGLIVSVVVGSIAGWLLGIPALRIRGIYLAMATIGFGFLVQDLFSNLDYTGAQVGFHGMHGTTLPIVYLVAAVVALFFFRLQGARLGKAQQAVREHEVVASTLGLNTTYVKLLSFSIGAATASLAGALYAHFILFISPEHFVFWESIWPAFYVLIGGADTVLGPVLGAAIVTLLPEYFRVLQEWRLLVFGIVMMVIIALRPQGLYARDVETWLLQRLRLLGKALLNLRPIAYLDRLRQAN